MSSFYAPTDSLLLLGTSLLPFPMIQGWSGATFRRMAFDRTFCTMTGFPLGMPAPVLTVLLFCFRRLNLHVKCWYSCWKLGLSGLSPLPVCFSFLALFQPSGGVCHVILWSCPRYTRTLHHYLFLCRYLYPLLFCTYLLMHACFL
jgi:hypothetical protein